MPEFESSPLNRGLSTSSIDEHDNRNSCMYKVNMQLMCKRTEETLGRRFYNKDYMDFNSYLLEIHYNKML